MKGKKSNVCHAYGFREFICKTSIPIKLAIGSGSIQEFQILNSHIRNFRFRTITYEKLMQASIVREFVVVKNNMQKRFSVLDLAMECHMGSTVAVPVDGQKQNWLANFISEGSEFFLANWHVDVRENVLNSTGVMIRMEDFHCLSSMISHIFL